MAMHANTQNLRDDGALEKKSPVRKNQMHVHVRSTQRSHDSMSLPFTWYSPGSIIYYSNLSVKMCCNNVITTSNPLVMRLPGLCPGVREDVV